MITLAIYESLVTGDTWVTRTYQGYPGLKAWLYSSNPELFRTPGLPFAIVICKNRVTKPTWNTGVNQGIFAIGLKSGNPGSGIGNPGYYEDF